MDDLRYKMIMALTAADFGNPSASRRPTYAPRSPTSTVHNCTSPTGCRPTLCPR